MKTNLHRKLIPVNPAWFGNVVSIVVVGTVSDVLIVVAHVSHNRKASIVLGVTRAKVFNTISIIGVPATVLPGLKSYFSVCTWPSVVILAVSDGKKDGHFFLEASVSVLANTSFGQYVYVISGAVSSCGGATTVAGRRRGTRTATLNGRGSRTKSRVNAS